MTDTIRQLHVYIAGPMTGIPDYNYPAFHEAAAKLRSLGYGLNPAENPDPLPRNGGHTIEWSDWLRHALAQVVKADAIALLPGWEDSPGAQLEVLVAHHLGMDLYLWDGEGLGPRIEARDE